MWALHAHSTCDSEGKALHFERMLAASRSAGLWVRTPGGAHLPCREGFPSGIRLLIRACVEAIRFSGMAAGSVKFQLWPARVLETVLKILRTDCGWCQAVHLCFCFPSCMYFKGSEYSLPPLHHLLEAGKIGAADCCCQNSLLKFRLAGADFGSL